MKITIITVGPRDDVEPLIALSLALQAEEHQVKIATNIDFEEAIRNRGIDFAPIPVDASAFARSELGRRAMACVMTGKLRQIPAEAHEFVRSYRQHILAEGLRAAEGADALIFTVFIPGAMDMAEKLDIPAIAVTAAPSVTLTGAFPLIGAPKIGMGRVGNRLSYGFIRLSHWMTMAESNRWRREALGLPPRSLFTHPLRLRGRQIPILHFYSAHLLPSPPEWSEDTMAAGFWLLDLPPGWQPTAQLEAFLAAGPPPVYIGFGSMAGTDPQRMTRLVLAALEQTGQRGILSRGWGGLSPEELPPSVMAVGDVPHSWLFPRMSLVVHHGGCGTLGAGLSAGKPAVICPMLSDQPFWAEISRQRGFAPPPIPGRALTAERLAAAIRTALGDPAMRRNAERLGRLIRAEDGPAKAVRFIKSRLQPDLPRPRTLAHLPSC